MIDMPPECPSGTTLIDVFDAFSIQQSQSKKPADWSCYLQTPDNLKGNEPKGYPYFDFESARKQNDEQAQLQAQSVSDEITPGEFYFVILFGGITFISLALGFLAGFIPSG
ncbi:hypothetical protein KAB87_004105 [Salmonella enterica]|nr:hypothetical protein [Salmonella enterica]